MHREASIAVSLIQLQKATTAMPVSGLGLDDEFVALPDIRLEAGDRVGMLTTGDAGDNPVKVSVAVEEEDVF